jgi:ATP-binding cassette, subfamily F, member 1
MGKKPRRRDDDDPMAEQLAKLAMRENSDEDEAPSQGKAGKVKTRKGVADFDNDDEQPQKGGKAGNKKGGGKGQDSDDDEDDASAAGGGGKSRKELRKQAKQQATAPTSKESAGNTKKGKKGRRGQDSDSDDDFSKQSAPVEEDVANTKPSKKDKKKDKKNKGKGGGGGRGRGDSSDEDPLAIMARLAAMESDEEESEEEAAEPVVKSKGKKNKKNMYEPESEPEEEEDGEEDEDEESEEEVPKKASMMSVLADSDSESSDEEEPAPKVVETVKETSKNSSSGGKMSKADRKKAKAAAKNGNTEYLAEKQAELDAEKQRKVDDAEASNAPKSKLQLKLEAARLAKEAKAAEEAALAAEKEEEEAAEAKRKRKEDRRAAKAAAKAAEEAGENAPTIDVVESKSKSVRIEPEEETEADKEARMMSTMYGDEAFSEWGHAKDETATEDSGKKLSRKELKKKAAAEEAALREAEYEKAAIKASMEGAQFAVSQTVMDPNDANWANALDIVIPSISISAHKKELFVNTELMIAAGRRYGLVGPNGAGKSTLLKMISCGELKVPPRVDYLYVEQEVQADETPAVDAVLRADKVRWALVQEEKEILNIIEKNGSNEKLDERLGVVYEELAACGAESAEAKARRILFGLGFDAEMQVRPTKYFSGGWRMRISLARALFIEPTLLMLDEPTNHLDLNAVIWLDDYLQKWKKTLLIVSHDQDFLNSVCQEILHLHEKKNRNIQG